ncbi:DegV family protein [Gordonia sp. (in: high G+C Gram-positive bacteria)]|uniref:DegV family protein n=1 Tax=Gordonia sp. (in: high G+C Gram-positive bacteria) TaxID=84139 RepID=UPI0026248FC8|nr:DegV family protein [Gordonia sp. (in: high G+C Gram-positive bacteria)]HMS77448.1 DegV family protein [Gordonia sp. (in: high G+C Gram-positive bacteria)]
MPVVVVTDSSSCLPPSVAGRYGIRRVPLHLTVDGVDYSDGVDEVPDDIVRVPGVSTSGANPHEIGEVFEEAVAASDGAGVVAVHISRRLSGTWSAARIAAEKFAGQVRVVDSRSVGLAVGFAAIAAAQAAETGADRDRVYEAAIRQAATLDSLYCVSTLDNLRASGRISAAGKMLGSALSIKPILHMVDGTMTLRERHRTFSKAIAKMQEGAVESAGGRAVTLGVQHCEAPELAREVADDLLEKLKTVTSSLIVEISPVLGCHVGPGAVGVVIGTHLDPIEGIPGD